jgi:hypothetical protein
MFGITSLGEDGMHVVQPSVWPTSLLDDEVAEGSKVESEAERDERV